MWNPVDTRFLDKKHPIGIANIGDMWGALLLRGLLENLGGVVHFHHTGTPGDFLEIIRQEDNFPPYLVICCHGEEDGIVFGDYSEGIDTSMLKKGNMPPECIAENIRLPECVVINTGCCCGEPAMARAFMSGKIKAYIGTEEPNPPYQNHALFLMHFFYAIWVEGRSEREAWEHAASYNKACHQYVLYDKEGRHRIE